MVKIADQTAPLPILCDRIRNSIARLRLNHRNKLKLIREVVLTIQEERDFCKDIEEALATFCATHECHGRADMPGAPIAGSDRVTDKSRDFL